MTLIMYHLKVSHINNNYVISHLSYRSHISVSVPYSVDVTNNESNTVLPIGSNIALTCTVELSPAVDVPVTVNTVWIRPAGATLSITPTVMNSINMYTSTATVSSFGRKDSGNYTCMAYVNFTSLFHNVVTSKSRTADLTVGMGMPTKVIHVM